MGRARVERGLTTRAQGRPATHTDLSEGDATMTPSSIALVPDKCKTRPEFRCALAECIHLQETLRRPIVLDDWWKIVGVSAPRATVERNWERFKAKLRKHCVPVRYDWDNHHPARKTVFVRLTKPQVDLV
jgi:hypothetical protein